MIRGAQAVCAGLSLFVSVVAWAEPKPCASRESVWRASTGKERVEACRKMEYDSKGRISRSIFDGWCNGRQKTQTDFEYHGEILSGARSIDLDQNVIESSMRASFNSDGTVRERCYWWIGRGSNCWRNVYDDGKLKYSILNSREAVTEYTVNENGTVDRELTTYYTRKKGKETPWGYSDLRYHYHANGQLRVRMRRLFDKNARPYSMATEYFDASGRITLKRTSSSSGNSDSRSEYRYTFGDDGRVLQSRMLYYPDGSRKALMMIRVVNDYECDGRDAVFNTPREAL